MDKQVRGPSPVAMKKMENTTELSAEELLKMHDIENLNALLAVYFKGVLKANNLFTVLKEAENSGKQFLIKSARVRLEGSFMEDKLPFKFTENGNGMLSVEMIKR